VRYGTCRVFVYLFYLGNANDSEHVLYVIRRYFQWEYNAIEIVGKGVGRKMV